MGPPYNQMHLVMCHYLQFFKICINSSTFKSKHSSFSIAGMSEFTSSVDIYILLLQLKGNLYTLLAWGQECLYLKSLIKAAKTIALGLIRVEVMMTMMMMNILLLMMIMMLLMMMMIVLNLFFFMMMTKTLIAIMIMINKL